MVDFNQQYVKAMILRWLNRRDHSRAELIHKLKAKKITHPNIAFMLDELQKKGFINDQRFAENFVIYRRQKGFGPIRIAQELALRGIKPDMIADLLTMTDNVWLGDIKQVWQKHFKNKLPLDFKTRLKHMRFLQYRGFSQDHIASLFKHSENIEVE